MSIFTKEEKGTTKTNIYNRILQMDNEKVNEYVKWVKHNKLITFTHVIDRHLNISDEQLKQRIKEEHKEIVSTYVCDIADLMEAIENAIIDEIRNYPECFFGWLFDHRETEDYDILFDLPENIKGFYFMANKSHDWDTMGHLVCSEGKIVLMKTDISGEDWDIRTSYADPTD